MTGLIALIVDSEILRWEVSKIHMLFILIVTHCMSVICGKVNCSVQVSLLLVRTFMGVIHIYQVCCIINYIDVLVYPFVLANL